MPKTFSPDPQHLLDGAGTAAQQTARPREYADHTNGGFDVASTGATAGSPGSFTPAGSRAPTSPAGMTGLVASPATAWTTGQYVTAGSDVYWNGSAWTAGRAPVVRGGRRGE